MRNYGLAVVAALSIGSTAYAQGDAVTATIPLNHIDAKTVATKVKILPGIDQLTCDFNTNSLIVRGTQTSVDSFKSEVQQVDVEPTIYQFNMRMVQYRVNADGKVAEMTLMSPVITTTGDTPASCSLLDGQAGFTLAVTLVKATEGKPTSLTVEVEQTDDQGEIICSGKHKHDVLLGKANRFVGMTDATDKALRAAAGRGVIVTDKGAYTGYYVEVTPMVQTVVGPTP